MDKLEAIRKCRSLISGQRAAMLTTADADGNLRSQPMAMNDIDDAACIWFFTRRESSAVLKDGLKTQCAVTIEDAGGARFIAMSGEAEVLDDSAREHELWIPELRAFFPDGVDAPDLVLVKFCVENVEYWDSPKSPVDQVVGFVKAALTRHSTWGGAHEQFVMPH